MPDIEGDTNLPEVSPSGLDLPVKPSPVVTEEAVESNGVSAVNGLKSTLTTSAVDPKPKVSESGASTGDGKIQGEMDAAKKDNSLDKPGKDQTSSGDDMAGLKGPSFFPGIPSYGDEPSKKGVPMPINIDMDDCEDSEDGQPAAKDGENLLFDGSIVWEALVYDADKDDAIGNFQSPVVIRYSKNQPISQTKSSSKNGLPIAEDKGTSAQITEPQPWNGPVFKLRYQIRARMPWLECKFPEPEARAILGCDCSSCQSARKNNSSNGPGIIYNKDELPKSPASHDVTSWSSPSLVIKSPHLFSALGDEINHYPGYFQRLRTACPKDDWEKIVPYPYAVLMHHFPMISELVSSTTDENHTSTRQNYDKEPDDAKDSEPAKFQKDPQLAKEHLKILHRYLKPIYESTVVPCDKALSESPCKISFDMLWYILKPGTTVYVNDEWTPWYTAVVSKVDMTSNEPDELSISLWFLSSDGARIGRYSPREVKISHYDGLRKVTILDICPVDIWDAENGDGRRTQAIDRGKLLEKTFRKGYLLANYTGTDAAKDLGYTGKVVVDHRRGQDMTGLALHAIGLPPDDKDQFSKYDDIYVNKPWNWGPQSLPLKGQKLSKTYEHASFTDPYALPDPQKSFPSRKVVPLNAIEVTDDMDPNRWTSTSKQDEPLSGPLEDEKLMLIYPLTFGFSLKSKVWIELDASRLDEIHPSDESIKNLVIGDDMMTIVKAVASRIKKPETWSADHIQGKGAGGIILLHGPPGVGKTYTVEAIAEMMDLPLLALTVGDIGTAETMIEHELAKWFALAELWRAVLLIDEADIFLERRQTRDLARNGLVSAFLRRAEYFNGLLFLTTNRVGQIDDAFISRIHVSIPYKNLSGKELVSIWNGFFDKLAKDKTVKIKVAPNARKWVQNVFTENKYPNLNGRDIRNALQTAITLAKFDYEEDPDFDAENDMVVVSPDHFQRVLEMNSKFREYVYSIRLQDENTRARNRGDRNDDENTPLSVRASLKASN